MPQTFLSEIAVHNRERGLAVGGSGSGKSTLCERLVPWFVQEYPNGRALIVDTKPRFRAADQLNGTTAKGLYKHWDHGTPVPGSVRLDLSMPDFGMPDAWKLGYRVAILQSEFERDRATMLAAIAQFFQGVRASRPQLLYVDEIADFFMVNGQPLRGAGDHRDAILRVVRAGRERGQAFLGATQRPVGIPVQIVQELTRLYLFRLDNEDDLDALFSKGVRLPEDAPIPEVDHLFYYFDKPRRRGGLYKLRL